MRLSGPLVIAALPGKGGYSAQVQGVEQWWLCDFLLANSVPSLWHLQDMPLSVFPPECCIALAWGYFGPHALVQRAA